MTIQTVYTHLRPGHIDDVVGTSVLAALLEADVRFIHPQDPAIPAILANPQAATVDVGGSYDPSRMHFDHHHDASLPCAAVLVLREVGPWESSAAWTHMSIKDTLGPQEAAARTREVSTDRDIRLERLVACLVPCADLGKAWIRAGIMSQRFDTFGALVAWLHDHAGAERIDEAEKAHRMIRAKGLLAIESSRCTSVILPDGQRIRVVTPGGPHPIPAVEAFRKHGASIAISPSDWPCEGSVWKMVRAESLHGRVDFSRLRGDADVSFAHNSGHLAVFRGDMPETIESIMAVIGRAWVGEVLLPESFLKSA